MKKLNFKSATQKLLVEQGKLTDDSLRTFIRNAIGANKKKVEAKRHSIISGTPGVGKTYGTMDECKKAGTNVLHIAPGTSNVDLVTKLATAVYLLKKDEELVCVLDDADDLLFSNEATLNKWKVALGDKCSMPRLEHSVQMSTTRDRHEAMGNDITVLALDKFAMQGSLGVSIPTDRVRFVILCNKDFEDPKQFRGKIKSGIPALLSRVRYKRIDLDWEKQWGWLAYILSLTQPFPSHPITNNQKIELLQWMFSNWKSIRNNDTSYRKIEELAEYIINEPNDYIDRWNEQLKGH